VLWHQGRPSCPELQDALHQAGLGPSGPLPQEAGSTFGPEAAKVAQRHAASCERCSERQRLALAPEALFAGVPLLVAGPQLRARVISSLRDAGVPMGEPSALSPLEEAAVPSDATRSSPPVLADGDEEAASARTADRRRALVTALLALLLLGGAIIFALARNSEPSALDTSTPLASNAFDSSTTTLPAVAPPPPGPAATMVTSPPGPGPTVPPATAAPKATTSTSGGTTSTTARPPVVKRFVATSVSPKLCLNQYDVQLSWTTADATKVMLTGPGAPTKAQAPSGTAVACSSVSPAEYVLTATGPGGTTTAKAVG